MAPRGEITLTVTFGPAATPVLPRAVAYAMEHAHDLSQEGPSTWRAIFRLGTDPETYFVSAEAHEQWRGAAPYDRYPMRRIASINLFSATA